MSDSVQSEIDKHGLKENVIWVKEFQEHDVILSVLSRADYYIILQKRSIFDYATLEAMALGAIPLLSSTGGNLETIEEGRSGFYIDGPEDMHKLSGLDEAAREKMSLNAVERQREKFSDKAFLERYCELVSEICGTDEESKP